MSKKEKLYLIYILIALQILNIILLFTIACYLGHITRYLNTQSLYNMFYR